MSTQVTYEINHISLIQDSTIQVHIFNVFYHNPKEKGNIKRNINSIKNKRLCRKSVLLFHFAKNYGQSGLHNKKLSCLHLMFVICSVLVCVICQPLQSMMDELYL